MQFEKSPGGVLVRKQEPIILAGEFEIELIRKGKTIDKFGFKNIVVAEGLNYLLGAGLGGAAQISTWFMGLFEGNYTPLATDTAASIAPNATETSTYSGGTRPQWSPAPPANQTITNGATRASFTFTADKTIYGAFLASSPTIGGTGGKLFGAARFPAPKAVSNTDVLLAAYAFTASAG